MSRAPLRVGPLRPGPASMGRRRVLTAGAGLLLTPMGASPGLAAGAAGARESAARRLVLRSVVTGEELDVQFHYDQRHVPAAMARIAYLLRDAGTGECHAVDPKLLDDLHHLARAFAVEPYFSVMAGFRSPQPGQARSLHSLGRAADVRLRGVDVKDLAERALALNCGGVGYYRRCAFVHLDTGSRRSWNG